MTAGTNTYTIVHTPTVERRTTAYLGNDLPHRYQALRDQLAQQHVLLGQAVHDALRYARAEAEGRDTGGVSAAYLSGVAANAAMVAETLRNASVTLQHAAHQAGYDTSALAPLSREIGELNDQIQSAYVAFTATWRGLRPAPVPV